MLLGDFERNSLIFPLPVNQTFQKKKTNFENKMHDTSCFFYTNRNRFNFANHIYTMNQSESPRARFSENELKLQESTRRFPEVERQRFAMREFPSLSLYLSFFYRSPHSLTITIIDLLKRSLFLITWIVNPQGSSRSNLFYFFYLYL